MRFEPAGITDDPDIRMASSVMDYIFRRLALDHLSYDQRSELGILSPTSARPRSRARTRRRRAEEVDPEELAQSVAVERVQSQRPRFRSLPRRQRAEARPGTPHSSTELIESQQGRVADAPLCLNCGSTAPGGQLLRLRGLRLDQWLQLKTSNVQRQVSR